MKARALRASTWSSSSPANGATGRNVTPYGRAQLLATGVWIFCGSRRFALLNLLEAFGMPTSRECGEDWIAHREIDVDLNGAVGKGFWSRTMCPGLLL